LVATNGAASWMGAVSVITGLLTGCKESASRSTIAPSSAATLDVRADRPPTPAPSALKQAAPTEEPAPAAEATAHNVAYEWSHAPNALRLSAAFPPPAGFSRVPSASGDFAAFARALPLKESEAKVVDYSGRPLYDDGHHPNIARVIDIDVGSRDLQQCADLVFRMNAEWRRTRGDRAMAYPLASGQLLSYARYLEGERVVPSGSRVRLEVRAPKRADSRAAFRAYLDDLFGWANTASLERASKSVALAEARPGDFFVMSGVPFGHAVLILDVARDGRGQTALLLAQSYIPAQSVQVLRPSRETAWFVLPNDAPEIVTPFWKPFAIPANLRRLP
jgi:hypothetical protein